MRETAVDESREETVDRVARHQADYCSKWNMYMLLVPPAAAAGSNFILLCFIFFALQSSMTFFLFPWYFIPIFLPSSSYERSIVSWVDDEPALFCIA